MTSSDPWNGDAKWLDRAIILDGGLVSGRQSIDATFSTCAGSCFDSPSWDPPTALHDRYLVADVFRVSVGPV